MALPVIPPPNGERFEGGYHVEKNPINGALTLVEPSKGKQFLKLSYNPQSVWKLKHSLFSAKPEAKRQDRKNFSSKSSASVKRKKNLNSKATKDISSEPSLSGIL